MTNSPKAARTERAAPGGPLHAAIAAAVDIAMREAIPHRYSPATAQKITDGIIARLSPAHAHGTAVPATRPGDSDPVMDEALRRVREEARR